MSTATATRWAVDPMHSDVQFKIKHLVISTVTGSFASYTAKAETDAAGNLLPESIHFEAQVDSISTGVADRDAHLKSADFFDATAHPVISFFGKSLEKVNAGHLKLTGYLTIRDISKEVVLDVEVGGTATDGYGQHKAGFEITGKINRKEFGLTWSAVTEAGGLVVADEVKLQLSIQLVKQG